MEAALALSIEAIAAFDSMCMSCLPAGVAGDCDMMLCSTVYFEDGRMMDDVKYGKEQGKICDGTVTAGVCKNV